MAATIPAPGGPAAGAPMVQTTSVYEVADFARWKRVWDRGVPAHRAAGVRRHQIHRHPADPNRFVVVRDFDDLDRARAYLASPERRQRMRAARVVACTDYLPRAEPEPG